MKRLSVLLVLGGVLLGASRCDNGHDVSDAGATREGGTRGKNGAGKGADSGGGGNATEPELDAGSATSDPDAGSAANDPLELMRDDEMILVPASYKSCTVHSDCTLVGATCSGCCTRVSIAAELESEYDARVPKVCSDYRGGMCDCGTLDELPRCVDGQCVARLRTDLDDCYSPTDQLEIAYEPGKVGCTCDKLDAAICVDGVALICMQVSSADFGMLAWTAVIDGPCFPRSPSCPNGTITASATACLEQFLDCYELPDKTFCGYSR